MDQCTWIRTVKRKYDEFEGKPQSRVLGLDVSNVAHVETKSECSALRDKVSNQQAIIQELSLELDEERNASSTAANEAMSMILKLQREKAEIQMEARQFKRFSEEKIDHDSKVISSLEDMLYKREQTIQSLTCEVQACKHRMMSFGLTESEADELFGDGSHSQSLSDNNVQEESPICNLKDMQSMKTDTDVVDSEKRPNVEAPHGKDHPRGKDCRLNVNRLRKPPRHHEDQGGDVSRAMGVSEKVIVHLPKPHTSSREDLSSDNPFACKKVNRVVEVPNKCSNASKIEDDMGDRVYTLDDVQHRMSSTNGKESTSLGMLKEHLAKPMTTSTENVNHGDMDVNKLCLKLKSLEADKESLRQTIIAMQTDKARSALLREISQQMCQDMPLERNTCVEKESDGKFAITKGLKWCLSILLWGRRERINKYICVVSSNKVGLLVILDKGPRTKHWRCITCTSLKRPLKSQK